MRRYIRDATLYFNGDRILAGTGTFQYEWKVRSSAARSTITRVFGVCKFTKSIHTDMKDFTKYLLQNLIL